MVLSFRPLKSPFSWFLMILQLATRDIFHILKLLYKTLMFCVASGKPNKQERCVSRASRRFITLLNAFNKVVVRLCSDGSTAWRCLCVCTTLITSVVFVCSPRCVRFWQRRRVIAFYFMRGSWFNMMRGKKEKKQAQFPNQLLVRLREARQQGADPGSTHVLFYVCCLSAVHADGTALPDFI